MDNNKSTRIMLASVLTVSAIIVGKSVFETGKALMKKYDKIKPKVEVNYIDYDSVEDEKNIEYINDGEEYNDVISGFMGKYNDEYLANYEQQVLDNIDIDVEDIQIYKFKDNRKAFKCATKLGDNLVTIYPSKKYCYIYCFGRGNTPKIKRFGGKDINESERESALNFAFRTNTMIFGFESEKYAEFFANIVGVYETVQWEEFIFFDLSKENKEEHDAIKMAAKECFGEEMTDGFVVDNVKRILA